MNITDKIKKYRIASIIATLLTVIIGTIAFILRSDSVGSYFERLPFKTLLYILIILDILIALSASFIFKGKEKIDIENCARPKFLYLLPALASAYIYFSLCKQIVTFKPDALSVVLLISAVFSQIFISSEYIKTGKTLTLISGFLHIVFCILVVAKLYFDWSIELNAPLKLLIQFTAVISALSATADLRVLTDNCSLARFMRVKSILLPLSLLSGIGAFIEAITHYDNYSSAYRIFPAFFFTCAVLEAVKFITASYKESSHDEIHREKPQDDSPEATQDSPEASVPNPAQTSDQ